ncbi:MAG: ankyrin repeat domain-containing protein [Candidatus Babeliales bacterium]
MLHITQVIFTLVCIFSKAQAMEAVYVPDERTPLFAQSKPQAAQSLGAAQTHEQSEENAQNLLNEFLIESAAQNSLKSVKACLAQGAQINGANKWGQTALHEACSFAGNSTQLVAYLLAQGADVHAPNWYLATPFYEAASRDNIPVLELLKKAGANPDAQTNDGCTAASIAVEWRALRTLAWLHSAGANMNCIDKFGGAPVHWAIVDNHGAFHGGHENADTLHTVLSHGGQLDITTQAPKIERSKLRLGLPFATGATPFHVAAFHDRVAMKKVLLCHALLFDPWNKDPQRVSFVDMLISRDQQTRAQARSLLTRRANRLREILVVEDSAKNTAAAIESKTHKGNVSHVYFSPEIVQTDMENFITALEQGTLDKIARNNMFKAAYDEMLNRSGSKCVIC